MSEVINWFTKSRCPESIIIYCEVVDYELSDTVFTEKEDVMTALKNIFAEMDIDSAEDVTIRLKIGKAPLKEWNYEDFKKHGIEAIKNQVLAAVNTAWDRRWNLNGWYHDGSSQWEFNFRRHNFV